MAIYLKAIKIDDIKEFVVYSYGGTPDNLIGRFIIKKDLSNWKLVKDAGLPVSGLIDKICKSYMKTSVFPDEITFQS